MKTRVLLTILLSLGYALNAYADTHRDVLIQKELDCIDQHQNNGLSWADVCYMPPAPGAQDSRIINQQLDQTQAALVPQTAFSDRVHTFDIAPQAFYYHYSESQKSRNMSGVWEGVQGKYAFRPAQESIFNTPVLNFYALEGLYATGKNDVSENEQRFSDNSITKLTIKNIPAYMFDNRILLGKDILSTSSIRVTPYTGFGMRYQTDHSSGHFNILDDGVTGVLGYDRSQLYYYIPTGVTFDLAANNDYQASWNVEYDYLIKGYSKYNFANADQFTQPLASVDNQNVRYSLDHGWGARTSLKLLKHLSAVDIYLEPYIRYWHLNASKAASGSRGGQDLTNTTNKNSTLEVGSSLGVQF